MKNRDPLIFGLLFWILIAPVSAGFAFENLDFSGPVSEPSGQIQPFIHMSMSDRSVDGNRLIVAQGGGPVSPGTETDIDPFEAEQEELSDVLEPVNRAFFQFNDKLYFWVLKPAARGYKAVMPEPVRVGVRNFFYNLAFPIRFVNCLLQGKGEGAANELGMFMVNTVFGIAGFLDVIPDDIKNHKEDLGQTFGKYGIGPGFYIVWPFLGPSTVRDSIGMAGDGFLNPLNYLDFWYTAGARAYDTVNETSLRIGEYEALKRAAIDPYVALRNAYHQNRISLIKD
jgi:phospholipid-binding lipoprotein MlaA